MKGKKKLYIRTAAQKTTKSILVISVILSAYIKTYKRLGNLYLLRAADWLLMTPYIDL